jgi:hypothetical protein
MKLISIKRFPLCFSGDKHIGAQASILANFNLLSLMFLKQEDIILGTQVCAGIRLPWWMGKEKRMSKCTLGTCPGNSG